MLKNIIGEWGASLNDGDYACALAALGVLEAPGIEQHPAGSDAAALANAIQQELREGGRTAVWRQSWNPGPATTPAAWRRTAHGDAAALAAAWRQYVDSCRHPRQRPRLAVSAAWRARADLFDFEALWGWLGRTEVALQALVVADGQASPPRLRWHWPLRVGVPAGAESTEILSALHAAQASRSWVAELSRCYTVGDARDACDLLVLTRAGLSRMVAQPQTRIRASFVVCLDDAALSAMQPADSYLALRERVAAAGVCGVAAGGGAFQLADWFVEVLREISHDLPVHAAVWGVGRWRFNADPIVVGDPLALDACRLLAIAERQDRVAAALAAAAGGWVLEPAATLGLGDDTAPTFGGPSGLDAAAPSPAAAVPVARRDLADDLRRREFVAESIDGVDTVHELGQQQGDIDQARVPRWIQADAWRPDAPEIVARALAPAQWNLLGVHISPSAVPRAGAKFPEEAVDFERGDVEVAVQVELSGARVVALDPETLKWTFGDEVRPGDMLDGGEHARTLLRGPLAKLHVDTGQTSGSTIVELAAGRMVLPAAGASTLALFGVLPAGQKKIEGRIAVIHKNRVLQTARLAVCVDADAGSGPGLDVIPEAPIYPRDDDLEERRNYDVAIQFSDVGGRLHLKVHRDGHSTPVQLDALQGPVGRIQRGLENAARAWDYSRSVLDQPILASSLRTLAAAGSELEQHLRKTCGDEIDRWERIHLVPSTNEFLPLEYVYGGPPPRMDATSCPNLLGGLERGDCQRAVGTAEAPAPCPNAQDAHFVCPMHFWGFRRVIERNGVLRPAAEAAASTPSRTVLTPNRRPYGKVGTLLFAASERAFKYETEPAAQAKERAELVKSLDALGATVTDVVDWDQWRTAARSGPDLMVLVAHTDVVDETPVLEIGKGMLLGRQEITAELSGAAGEPQLLLLLGCSAADVTENFQPYPERFRDAGVSIVMAPVAPIRGKDAVPIARQIVRRLAERLGRAEPAAFGELMPLLRRELLRAGHPGVMGIVGFGDGDWLLGGP